MMPVCNVSWAAKCAAGPPKAPREQHDASDAGILSCKELERLRWMQQRGSRILLWVAKK